MVQQSSSRATGPCCLRRRHTSHRSVSSRRRKTGAVLKPIFTVFVGLPVSGQQRPLQARACHPLRARFRPAFQAIARSGLSGVLGELSHGFPGSKRCHCPRRPTFCTNELYPRCGRSCRSLSVSINSLTSLRFTNGLRSLAALRVFAMLPKPVRGSKYTSLIILWRAAASLAKMSSAMETCACQRRFLHDVWGSVTSFQKGFPGESF
mmetsp:Transcript_12661/g.28949  ORF Transcript_12661/g.28949 Transcript_12661/m.28949 type:complete len:207 (+) Transcript_12661:139-759(+)